MGKSRAAFSRYLSKVNILSSVSKKPNHHAWLELDEAIIDPSLPDGDRKYFFGGSRTYEEYLKIVKICKEQIEVEKKKGSPLLPDRVKQDLQPDILQKILNPDYDDLLEGSIERQMSLSTDKKEELDRACAEAKVFQEKQGWPLAKKE